MSFIDSYENLTQLTSKRELHEPDEKWLDSNYIIQDSITDITCVARCPVSVQAVIGNHV